MNIKKKHTFWTSLLRFRDIPHAGKLHGANLLIGILPGFHG
ncbi:hypothetical protein [Anaerophaga thermohalophila]|nr:hypothetical protein [Anaerophaga thermohalophila]